MSVTPRGYASIAGSRRPARPGAKKDGPADPHEIIEIMIQLRRGGAVERQDRKNLIEVEPGRLRLPSRRRAAEIFGASKKDIEKVEAFARKNGLKVLRSDAAKRSVRVSGTIEAISKAFKTAINWYSCPTEKYRGRVGSAYVPKELKDIVVGVFGLDTRDVAKRRPPSSPALATGGRTAEAAVALPSTPLPPASVRPLTPVTVADLYNFPRQKAAGQTVGILEFWNSDAAGNDMACGYRDSDVEAFFRSLDPPLQPPKILSVAVNGASNSPGGVNDAEVVLDIDVVGAVANDATIVVYFSTGDENGWIQALQAAIHPRPSQPRPSILSISWGGAESEWTKAALASMADLFEEAAYLGITVLAATGDRGSHCGVGDGKAHAQYPACDPFVTACGGTMVTYLGAREFKEATWNNSKAGQNVTGGGISDNPENPLPSWQQNAKVPVSKESGRKGRGIPDVAGNASPYSGYSIFLNDQKTAPMCGTSAVAPLYAGLVAIINAALGRNVGLLNPTLYDLGGTDVFRDIDDDADNADQTPGTPPAPSYRSRAGWAACTGWGSIDGERLLAALRKSAPAGKTQTTGSRHPAPRRSKSGAPKPQPEGNPAMSKNTRPAVTPGAQPTANTERHSASPAEAIGRAEEQKTLARKISLSQRLKRTTGRGAWQEAPPRHRSG